MEEFLLGLFCIFATLACVVLLIPYWIAAAKRRGLVGKDMNKYDKHDVPEGGGIAIVMAIVLGISLLIFIKTFILGTETNLIPILGIMATILLAGFIGFVDDMLGWMKGIGVFQKIIMTIPIVLPLVVINISHSTINLPFLGVVNLGYLYPLLVVPVGIIGATNGFNLVAGMNGVESGLGAIILGSLGVVAYFSGMAWLALICFIAVAALVGFLLFNFSPAKVFISDSGTYTIGALIGCVAILGNMEKVALFMFALYFIDILLYLKAEFIDRIGYVHAFGVPNKDDSLELPYNKLYDSCHVALATLRKIKRKVFEWEVVIGLWITQIIISLLVLRFVWL